MIDFAPFTMRAGLAPPAGWTAWVGEVLRGEPTMPPSAPDFPCVERLLARHGVLPLLYDRLRAQPVWLALPEEMRSGLAAAFRASAARTFLLEAEIARIAGVVGELVLLKGAALGCTAYANPALRPVSDLDLLVARERVSEVQNRLASIGYRGAGMAAHPRLGHFARRYRAELPLAGSAPGLGPLLVELHWSLAEIPHYVDLISASEVQDGALPLSAAQGCRVPRPSVLLAHAAGHLALHHSRDLRLIWLVDLDCLVRAGRIDWDHLLRLAANWKLGLALSTGLTLANAWLATPVEPEVTAELRRLAGDPVERCSWGLGDERRGRTWRRAWTGLTVLPPRSALRYAGWLGVRAALRPFERVLPGLERIP